MINLLLSVSLGSFTCWKHLIDRRISSMILFCLENQRAVFFVKAVDDELFIAATKFRLGLFLGHHQSLRRQHPELISIEKETVHSLLVAVLHW